MEKVSIMQMEKLDLCVHKAKVGGRDFNRGYQEGTEGQGKEEYLYHLHVLIFLSQSERTKN